MTTHTLETTPTTTFLSLPYELRTSIYAYAFGINNVSFSTSRVDSDALLPHPDRCTQQYGGPRCAQLLRVCKTILLEARPILYSQTTFHVASQVFAGRLPTAFASNSPSPSPRSLTSTEESHDQGAGSEVAGTGAGAPHPFAHHVRHLIHQIDSDMMKHLYVEDIKIRPSDLRGLETLEIRARAETWRDSFLGEDCDRERFVKGRAMVLQFGALVKGWMMGDGDDGKETRQVELVEDRTFLGRGCVRVHLRRVAMRRRGVVGPNVSYRVRPLEVGFWRGVAQVRGLG